MTKSVLVPIANGIEELEAVCIIDVLRRAGASVFVASIEDQLQVKASRGVLLVADCSIRDCLNQSFDLIVLPGGMPGAERLRDSSPLKQLLKTQEHSQKLYAAICASPAVVLQHHELLGSRRATCYPSFASQLQNADTENANVVVDANCITSRGPGTALEFSLKLVELLFGNEKAKNVANGMLALWS